MREIKPLEDMTREELIEEVQLALIVVGERQAEIEIKDERIAQLRLERESADAEIQDIRKHRDQLLTDIDHWKERCQQASRLKNDCQKHLAVMVEKRDVLKRHVEMLEAANHELRDINTELHAENHQLVETIEVADREHDAEVADLKKQVEERDTLLSCLDQIADKFPDVKTYIENCLP